MEPGPLLSPQYASQMAAFDELCAPAGAEGGPIRGHWKRLFGSFQQLGGEDLEARRQEARRLFRENGVSYSAAGDGTPRERPFELDPVPYLVPAEAWARVDSGLNQRARLLDAILKDLYGPRHLIRGGMVPPELIFRHGGFLLPADASLGEGRPALTLYAADVVRDRDGDFRVVSDRTQAPAGAGLALETRIATSRILPNLIRTTHVHRLARFFRLLRDNLAAHAPHQKLDPRIVVLAQGAEDPNYFDHAYLASYLGFPLVEGPDLTVRDGRLWLRTIEGLKLVDTVVRRIADHLCDPLELDPSSQVGIPGLLQVMRRREVAMVNPLGAGVLENPGLTPYLPRIARQFLGEDLKLESVPTWWCGTEEGLSHVLSRLDELVIKHIDRSRAAVWGGALSAAELARLRERLRADPAAYVGQLPGGEATTPALVEGELRPHRAVTRCFVSAVDEDFIVMPGGFTRVTPPGEIANGLSAGLQGTCKDTWILASEEERHLILWPTAASEPRQSLMEALPSRAAESLYWVGRYAERAEYLARLARTALRKFHDSRDYGDPSDTGSLAILLRALKVLSTGQAAEMPPGTLGGIDFVEATLIETVKDATLEGSLASTFKSLQNAALSVRDRWSADTWRVIDDVGEALETDPRFAPGGLAALEDTLDRLVSALMSFTGLTMESTTHENGWRFLIIGRRIARARSLIRLLQSTVLREAEEGIEYQLLESLLFANESVMTHRRRYRAALDIASATQVLLLDPTNPRSLAYQVLELQELLQALPHDQTAGMPADQRAMLEAATLVRLAEARQISASSSTAGPDAHRRQRLAKFLDKIDGLLGNAAAALDQSFFTHVEPTQQLVAVSLDAGASSRRDPGID
jgi:uncharacterized circularly permuted ATP-grasp superfamily protein/uncharacterized alpha-E superfamily protein